MSEKNAYDNHVNITILRIDCYYFTDQLLLFYELIDTILRIDCYYFTDRLLLFYGQLLLFYGLIIIILWIDYYYFRDRLLLFYGLIKTILRIDCYYYFTDR